MSKKTHSSLSALFKLFNFKLLSFTLSQDVPSLLYIINDLDNNYIYVGGNINQIVGNFQVLIQDQNGNTLQTFTTSGTYTVEVLQQIIDTINSNTATIIDPIV